MRRRLILEADFEESLGVALRVFMMYTCVRILDFNICCIRVNI